MAAGYVIAVVRGRLERSEFETAFTKEKVDIPKAPALGLLLDNVSLPQCNLPKEDRSLYRKHYGLK